MSVCRATTVGATLTPRARVLALGLTMALVALVGVGLAIWRLYTAAFQVRREGLVAVVEGRARLIEAVARFDAVYSVGDHPAGPAAATISQVMDSHQHFVGFGETGEFLLGRLVDDHIEFLLERRFPVEKGAPVIRLDSNLAEPMRRALRGDRGIFEAGRRGSALTSQMLSFSRERDLAAKVVEWGDLVDNMATMLRRLLGEDIALTLERHAREVRVKADVSQLEQIALNLAINARDAMPVGGELQLRVGVVEVTVPPRHLVTLLGSGQYAYLDVVDTGSGMSEATQEHIFEPFFTTKEVGRGTGLGLATVFAIIDNLKGGIALDSAIGKGTAFRIYLPLCTEALTTEVAERPVAPPVTGHQLHIMVVEDDVAVRSMVVSMLQPLGYLVTAAIDGLHALDAIAAAAAPPDLVISDVVMPQASGPQLVGRLRETFPELPVIFMSGYRKDARADEGAMPAHGSFLRKPFGKQELYAAVSKAFARSAGRTGRRPAIDDLLVS